MRGLGAGKHVQSSNSKITHLGMSILCFRAVLAYPSYVYLDNIHPDVCNYREIQDPTFSQCTLRYLRLCSSSPSLLNLLRLALSHSISFALYLVHSPLRRL